MSRVTHSEPGLPMIRVEDETTCRGSHHKSLRKAEEANFKANFFVLHESFDRRSTRIWSEIYSALCSCWFIAIWDFPF